MWRWIVPSCHPADQMELKRGKHVIILWTHASSASLEDGLSPTDYGLLQPAWLDWPSFPAILFGKGKENQVISQAWLDEENASDMGTARTSLVEENASDIDDSNDEPKSEDRWFWMISESQWWIWIAIIIHIEYALHVSSRHRFLKTSIDPF